MVTDYECAVLAAHVYHDDPQDFELPKDWRAIGDTTGADPSVPKIYGTPDMLGFDARAYHNAAIGEIVVSFRGTDASADMPANISQFMGHISPQLYFAMMFFMRVLENATGSNAPLSTGRLVLTGHSLGGSLASQVSVLTGQRAVVFTPAPHRRSIKVYLDQLRYAQDPVWPVLVRGQDQQGNQVYHAFVPQSVRRFVRGDQGAPTLERILLDAGQQIHRILYDGELAQNIGGSDVLGGETLYNQDMIENDRYVVCKTFSPWVAGLEDSYFDKPVKGMRYALHSYGLYVLQAYLERHHAHAAKWLQDMPALLPQLCNKHVTWTPITAGDPKPSLADFLVRLVTAADKAGPTGASVLNTLLGDLGRIAGLADDHIGKADREVQTGLLQLALQHAANQVRGDPTAAPRSLFTGNGAIVELDFARFADGSGPPIGLRQLSGYLATQGVHVPQSPSKLRVDATAIVFT